MLDFIIQAGHEGGVRNGGVPTVGTAGEQARTPVVANRMADILKAYGFTVQRIPALYPTNLPLCKLAVSLHFDGSVNPGTSGASIGYPDGSPAGSNKPAADKWKEIYSTIWPFKWMNDNFTAALKGYYGYQYTDTEIAEVLLELGELTDPAQRAWLDENIANDVIPRALAYWATVVVGRPVPSLKPSAPVAPEQSGIDAAFVEGAFAQGWITPNTAEAKAYWLGLLDDLANPEWDDFMGAVVAGVKTGAGADVGSARIAELETEVAKLASDVVTLRGSLSQVMTEAQRYAGERDTALAKIEKIRAALA